MRPFTEGIRGTIRAITYAIIAVAFTVAPFKPVVAASAQIVKNINTTLLPQGSFPQPLGALNGRVLFGATDATGPGLWQTDGTDAGTVLIKRLGGSGVYSSSQLINFLPLGGLGYFVADDGTTGLELWVTDGTTAGTHQVVDLLPGSNGSTPRLKGIFSGRLVFEASDAATAPQLYISDGTAAGSRAI